MKDKRDGEDAIRGLDRLHAVPVNCCVHLLPSLFELMMLLCWTGKSMRLSTRYVIFSSSVVVLLMLIYLCYLLQDRVWAKTAQAASGVGTGEGYISWDLKLVQISQCLLLLLSEFG